VTGQPSADAWADSCARPADPLLLAASAWDLLGREVRAVRGVPGGRNSRVYQVAFARGRPLAAKCYPEAEADPRDRLGAEVAALHLLCAHGIECVPRVAASDPARRCAFFTWVEGRVPDQVTDEDLDALAAFLARMQSLREEARRARIRSASEACFSLVQVHADVDKRVTRLREAATDPPHAKGLRAFLDHELEPAWDTLRTWSLDRERARGASPEEPLPPAARVLSPSDYGFHNALRDAQGTLTFLDFEYFGFDDPAKMLADYRLHPAEPVDEKRRARFLRRMIEALGEAGVDTAGLADRVRARYPLFALKWCAILLNEFVPADRARRRFAAGAQADTDAVRAAQLVAARKLLRRALAARKARPVRSGGPG